MALVAQHFLYKYMLVLAGAVQQNGCLAWEVKVCSHMWIFPRVLIQSTIIVQSLHTLLHIQLQQFDCNAT